MSGKERQRFHLLQMAAKGRITLREAGVCMGVSYRHAKRLKRCYVMYGARGIIHGNRKVIYESKNHLSIIKI